MNKQSKLSVIVFFVLFLCCSMTANALDKTSPTAIILSASHATISGVASDVEAIIRVELIVKNSNSQYWNGTGFGELERVVTVPLNDSSWQYQFSTTLPPDNYTVIAFPFDEKETIPVNWDSVSFSVLTQDIEPPTASISRADDSVLSGVASDNVLVDRVELAISNSRSEYWNGKSFGNYERVWAFLRADGTWHYQFSPLLPPDDYTVVTFPFDSSENTAAINEETSFTVVPPDYEPPVATIDSANDAFLSGHSTDNVLVSRIELAITNSNAQYWNGSTFGSHEQVEATLHKDGTWQYQFSQALAPDHYRVLVFPFDSSENTPVTQNEITFTVLAADIEAPSATISGAYNSVITGFSNDNVLVSRVELAIRNSSKQYWNGSYFVDHQQHVHANLKQNGVWLYTFSPLLPQGSYSVTAYPFDSAENTPEIHESMSFSVLPSNNEPTYIEPASTIISNNMSPLVSPSTLHTNATNSLAAE